MYPVIHNITFNTHKKSLRMQLSCLLFDKASPYCLLNNSICRI